MHAVSAAADAAVAQWLLDTGVDWETLVRSAGAGAARCGASHLDTRGAFSLVQTQNEPRDFGPPMHIHHDAAEAFFVLEGDYLMYLEDRQEECSPGTFVYVPRGAPHTFKVVSQTSGKKLNIFVPAAMQGFFEELAAAEATGSVSAEDLGEIPGRHHMEVVGPIPDTYL